MDNFDDDLSSMHINYEKVVESDMLAVTRLLAANILKNPYMRVGDFIKNLADGDLEALRDIVEGDSDHPRFEELLVISEMLAKAEGLSTDTLDDMTKRTNMLCAMLTLESLFRKGLIELYHDNMSFGDEEGDKMIAKLKDQE